MKLSNEMIVLNHKKIIKQNKDFRTVKIPAFVDKMICSHYNSSDGRKVKVVKCFE